MMAKVYEDFEDDDHEGGDEDEDIGALGSILSWDEDEDGGVGGGSNAALSDRESGGLPDFVSLNQSLQQLHASQDASGLSLPLPTPINYADQQITPIGQSQSTASQHEQGTEKNDSKEAAALAAAPPAPGAVAQAQPQVQQQIPQQYQIQQPQAQLLATQAQAQQPTRAQTQQTVPAPTAAQPHPVAHPAAFQLFQQGALLAQSQGGKQQPMIPTIMVPSVAQPGQDAQTSTQQFAFAAADPTSFLRQLQVAQLQHQFNAAQQARPLTQQVVAPTNAVPQAIQPQMQFQGQIPAVSAVPSQAPPAPATKRARSTSQKTAPPASSLSQTNLQTASKTPLVSASDTDGELSTKAGSKTSKRSTNASTSLALARKKMEIDTSNMTPEEKAKANRDRNREHARNTRLRKKAYLEKLKSTVDELCRERDTLVSERAGAANILVEMHGTRTEVLMSFFALRSANEKRRELWSSILDESCFACVMPVTPYRSFPASEVQVSKCQRTILGIDGMMSDTASLHVLLNSLVDRSRFPNATIVFRYTLVTEDAVVAGNQMMARWVMSTLNATQCGARMEVAKQGMLCCKFNSAHKIIGLELMFDVMALMLQLKQAAGSETFSVIPNTVQTCQRSFDKPMVMMLAEEPYTIVQVNKLWEDMTGYKAEEVVGKASCRILEGEGTEPGAVEVLMNEIRFKRPASALILYYKKSGEQFRNFFNAYPLSTDSRITHYLSLSSHLEAAASLTPHNEAVGPVVQGKQPNPPADKPANANLLPSQATAVGPAPAQTTFYGGMPPITGASTAAQGTVNSGAPQVFGLPTVISNPLVRAVAPGSVIQTSDNMSNFQIGGLKRPQCGTDTGPATKQVKRGGLDIQTDSQAK